MKAGVPSLSADRYRIFTASSGADGLDILAHYRVGGIISDQCMPAISGSEFIARNRALFPDMLRMILSAYPDLQSVTDAVNHGEISRFMTKPWNDAELRETLRKAFERYRRDYARS